MALLENEHIRLRALEPEDLDLLYRWENNTDLWTIGHSINPYSRYILKEYIENSHRDIFEVKQLRLVIEYSSTGNAIGLVDLFDFEPYHRHAGVGILLDPEYQGKGLASEALKLLIDYSFSFLKLHQLYANVPVINESSKRLFSHCGFILTGTLVDWITIDKEYVDVLVMQLVNKEV